ncbi:MAG: shikimate dehydrogenase [Bacteroidetes bacterium]|nr:shikimate dehydrogenase [Bacteroidota bacterium]
MDKYGLIGHPLSHSFSKKYFNEKFLNEGIEAEYCLYDLPSLEHFSSILDDKALKGLSVTIPYKESIIPFLDELDKSAKECGAVNCIKIEQLNGKPFLTGYNTDIYGFKQSIKPFLESKHSRALILGTGGASKAVQFVLKEIGVDFLLVSRNPKGNNQISYQDLNDYAIKAHLLIVNATPLGMSPNVDTFPPIPFEAISSDHFLYDLVYNPAESIFLNKGKEQGSMILNGLDMLKMQAEKAWEIFG